MKFSVNIKITVMKKLSLVILLLSMILVGMVSCDVISKECEQVSDIIGYVPELNKNDYNDCDVVNQNYMYFAKWNIDSYMEHYPATEYLSQQGDTVMIMGFISHGYNKTIYYNDNYWAMFMDADSIDAMDVEYNPCDLTIYGDNMELLNNLDLSQKCYVKGTVQFVNILGYENTPPDPKSCFAKLPEFKVFEIRN